MHHGVETVKSSMCRTISCR